MYTEIPGTMERTISEQIRDLYFDRIFAVIFASDFRGKIRILSTTELDAYLMLDGLDTIVHQLVTPSLAELAGALQDPTAEVVNVYFPL